MYTISEKAQTLQIRPTKSNSPSKVKPKIGIDEPAGPSVIELVIRT